MSNPTSNFGWQMPTPTDLVTSLPADFEVFGQAVDTSMADLKGGTTGQILSKATNTNMDFVWIANDQGDITAVNVTSPITGGGTSGAVTVGIQSASTSQSGAVQLSDSTSTTSSVLASTPTATKAAYDLAASAYAPAFTNNYYAGKNRILNSNFSVWQRGTSGFSTPGYTADQWYATRGNGAVGVSQQTFTPGAAPASGYEGQYFLRYAITSGSTSGTPNLQQRIEDVRTLAGQSVTVSFWAKASSSASPASIQVIQNFGSGGSAEVTTTVATTPSYTTSWVRYSYTISVPSVSGKTIGTSSYLALVFNFTLNTSFTSFDIWGVQVEAGSVATPFQTATGTIQGELAACQRYYYRLTPNAAYNVFGSGFTNSSTAFLVTIPMPVPMRIAPTALDQSGTASQYSVFQGSGGFTCSSVPTLYHGNQFQGVVSFNVASGLTVGQAGIARTDNNSTAYLGWTAEL